MNVTIYKTNCAAGRFGTEAPLESIEAIVIITPATDIEAYPQRSLSPARIPEATHSWLPSK